MKEAAAFAPCHITGIFQICDNSVDPLRVGSRGAGVSMSLGVRTVVKASPASSNSVHISINNVVSDSAEVSENVVRAFLSSLEKMKAYDLTVEHHVDIPIGAGLGTSGAAALSLALALNDALRSDRSRIEAAQSAHRAEVECRTGLGTVIAETFGGAEIRTKPGAPGIGEIKSLRTPKDTSVACLVFGPMSTRRFLTDPESRRRINDCGGKLVDELIRTPTIYEFMKLSRRFAEEVGLMTDRVRNILDFTDKAGVICSMPMFGESIFTITEPKNVKTLLHIFRNEGSDGRVFLSKVDRAGARLI
jgi:pantoate kinase